MICTKHNAAAAFYSEKEERYVCFKCVVASEKLLYIDKNYQHQMDDFERIKKLAHEAIKSNWENTKITATWKRSIRDCLMKIRERFNENIDRFIYQFATVFKNVEMSNELMEFRGEDKRLLK